MRTKAKFLTALVVALALSAAPDVMACSCLFVYPTGQYTDHGWLTLGPKLLHPFAALLAALMLLPTLFVQPASPRRAEPDIAGGQAEQDSNIEALMIWGLMALGLLAMAAFSTYATNRFNDHCRCDTCPTLYSSLYTAATSWAGVIISHMALNALWALIWSQLRKPERPFWRHALLWLLITPTLTLGCLLLAFGLFDALGVGPWMRVPVCEGVKF